MLRIGMLSLLTSFVFVAFGCSSNSKPRKRSPVEPCAKPAADSKTPTNKDANDRTSTQSTAKKTSNNSKYDLVADKVTWDDDIAPLIKTNCISCHDQGTKTPPELHRMPSSKRVLAEVVESVSGRRPSMPKGDSLSSRNQDLFLSWEDDGFLEEAQNSSSRSNTTSSSSSSKSNDNDPYDNASNRSSAKKSTSSKQDSASESTKNPC